jgi:VanZ family protein
MWRVLLVALVLVIAVLAFSPPQAVDVPGSDKLHHVLAFAVLMVVGGLALAPGAARLGLMATALIGYGAFIEAVQSQIPGRHASLADGVADAIGVGVGLLVVVLLRRRAGTVAA